MNLNPGNLEQPKREKRPSSAGWFQFSLRLLFLLTILVAVFTFAMKNDPHLLRFPYMIGIVVGSISFAILIRYLLFPNEK